MLDAFPDTPLTHDTLADLRKGVSAMLASRPTEFEGATETEKKIPGLGGAPDVRVLLYTPVQKFTSAPALLHIHGGGYVAGVPEMSAQTNANIAARLGAVVVSVDYRLAPEYPFPLPLDDCYAALAWMHKNADALNIDRRRISVAGDSAGGGLAAALALRARDKGEFTICSQHLNSPMLDDRTGTDIAPRSSFSGEFLWTRDKNAFGWRSYLGDAPRETPNASPSRIYDLSELPRAWIAIGALDESIDYAQRLVAAGVPVDFEIYAGGYHGFQLAAEAAVAKRYARAYMDSFARAWDIS